MVRHPLILALISASAFAFAGCNVAPAAKPVGKAVVPVETKADRAVGSAQLLNEVEIELPALTTSGTQWAIVFNDSRYLQQLRPIVTAGAGRFVAAFLAVKPGHRLVRFCALPMTSREAEPTQTYEVVIDIAP